jgi:hypothetical protein
MDNHGKKLLVNLQSTLDHLSKNGLYQLRVRNVTIVLHCNGDGKDALQLDSMSFFII